MDRAEVKTNETWCVLNMYDHGITGTAIVLWISICTILLIWFNPSLKEKW